MKKILLLSVFFVLPGFSLAQSVSPAQLKAATDMMNQTQDMMRSHEDDGEEMEDSIGDDISQIVELTDGRKVELRGDNAMLINDAGRTSPLTDGEYQTKEGMGFSITNGKIE